MPQLVINEQAISLSNLEKVFWPEDGYTSMIADFYIEISAFLLPYLMARNFQRFPDGIHGKSFYQKICRNLHRIDSNLSYPCRRTGDRLCYC